jgi:hypothetical protein
MISYNSITASNLHPIRDRLVAEFAIQFLNSAVPFSWKEGLKAVFSGHHIFGIFPFITIGGYDEFSESRSPIK